MAGRLRPDRAAGAGSEAGSGAGAGFVPLAAGRVVAALLSWVWLAVAARELPVGSFGDLALLLAIGSMSCAIADLGLPLVLMQVVAERPASARAALALTIRRRLGAGVGAAAVVAVAYSVATGRLSIAVPCAYGISLLATTVYTSVNAAMRAVGQPRAEAANEVLSRMAVLAVGWWWLASGGGLLAAVVTYAGADVASAALLVAIAHRRLPVSAGTMDPDELSVRRAAPLALGGVLGTVYNRIDVWLLALMSGSLSVAAYAAAGRVLEGLLLPAGSLSALVVPNVARAPGSREAVLKRLTVRAVLLVAPLALAVGLLAGPILGLAFGSPYRGGGGVLAVLMGAAVPGAVVLVAAPVAALGDPRRFVAEVAAGLALNLAANAALLPRYGAVGAAWATVVSQVVLSVRLWRLALRSCAEPPAGPVTAGMVAHPA